MKFGVREICDVVLKAKAQQTLGSTTFAVGQPVLYFDSLKTSSLEGQSSTVYAQGGKGNPRLVAWDGDRTLTFTMEDALISPLSFAVLSGAGLIEASANSKIYVHTTEQVVAGESGSITLKYAPSDVAGATVYIMKLDANGAINGAPINVATGIAQTISGVSGVVENNVVLVDYYREMATGAQQIDIEAGKFGGTYYLEASTLFRNEADGADYPAEFVIPKCKIQSNFTFTMAPTGDPSTFTFTMDAFPDYTKFDKTKKVLAALQIVETPVN